MLQNLVFSLVESMILTVRAYKITILKSARNVRLVVQTPAFGPLFQPQKVPIISQEKSFDFTTRSATENRTCLGVGSEPPLLNFTNFHLLFTMNPIYIRYVDEHFVFYY